MLKTKCAAFFVFFVIAGFSPSGTSAQENDICSWESLEAAVAGDQEAALGALKDVCSNLVLAENTKGENLIFVAARLNALRSMQWLLQNGVSVAKTNDQGCNALCFVSGPESADLLLTHGADATLSDRRGLSPFYHLLPTENWALLDRLRLEGAVIGENELIRASSHYHLDALNYLAENVRQEEIAGKGAFFRHFHFYEESYRALASALIAKGADLNQATLLRTGMPLLESYVEEYVKRSAAYERNGLVAIKFLLENGASANGTSSRFGDPILFYALGWRFDAPEIAHEILDLFVAYGFDLNLRNKDEAKTLLMEMASLQVSGATQESYVDRITTRLLSLGADPNLQSKDGRTALHWAIRAANRAAGTRLAAVTDLSLRDRQGMTAGEYLQDRLEYYQGSPDHRAALEAIEMAMRQGR